MKILVPASLDPSCEDAGRLAAETARAVGANLPGTTGASMLLIHPLLRANAQRKRKSHIVIFFIIVAANIGGLPTPIGDPPLYLGYLRGVPFFWTVKDLWPPWLAAAGMAIGTFYLLDRHAYRSEEQGQGAADPGAAGPVPLSLVGA